MTLSRWRMANSVRCPQLQLIDLWSGVSPLVTHPRELQLPKVGSQNEHSSEATASATVRFAGWRTRSHPFGTSRFCRPAIVLLLSGMKNSIGKRSSAMLTTWPLLSVMSMLVRADTRPFCESERDVFRHAVHWESNVTMRVSSEIEFEPIADRPPAVSTVLGVTGIRL